MKPAILFLFALSSLLGCSGEDAKKEPATDADADTDADTDANSDADADADSDADADADTDADTKPDPQAPTIVSFTSDVAEITAGGSATFSVVAADPQGSADLIGGLLVTPGNATYGALVADPEAGPGAYAIALSWDQINDVSSIDIEQGVPAARVFVAHLFDKSGNEVKGEVTVSLSCGALGGCDGVCTDLAADGDNCGECGRVCPGVEPGGDSCVAGLCLTASACVEDLDTTCEDVCVAGGYLQCFVYEGDMAGVVYVGDELTCPGGKGVDDVLAIESCTDNLASAALKGLGEPGDIGRCVCAY